MGQVKHSHFLVYVISVRSQTVQETETGQFALLTSLHPGSANDSQAAATHSGIYNEITGLPFDPRGRIRQESTLFFRTDSVRALSLPPSIYPSTNCTKNNGLFSCASAPLRGLWLGSAAGLRFQPHVLHSNQKSQPWQYGRIAEGDTKKKYEQGRGGKKEGKQRGEAEEENKSK